MLRNGISKEMSAYLNQELSNNGLSTSDIIKMSPVYGGSINESFTITTQKERFFIKINSASEFPMMFEREKAGLELLRVSTALKVPFIHLLGEHDGLSFLLMENIEPAAPKPNFWEDFGRGLAQLHQNTQEQFGLNYDNYIGSLIQKNSKKKDWLSFFIENRLHYQAKLAFEKGLVKKSLLQDLEQLYLKLDAIFPKEPPALCHGDLWSGNFMVGKNGEPVIMDPAIYFGHREMDLAMMHLFGGFNRKLYDAYHEVYPLTSGWENRIEVCNLYPLLVHVNLFGEGYVSRVKNILEKL